jgi:hypothetical protein
MPNVNVVAVIVAAAYRSTQFTIYGLILGLWR